MTKDGKHNAPTGNSIQIIKGPSVHLCLSRANTNILLSNTDSNKVSIEQFPTFHPSCPPSPLPFYYECDFLYTWCNDNYSHINYKQLNACMHALCELHIEWYTFYVMWKIEVLKYLVTVGTPFNEKAWFKKAWFK